MVDDAAITDEQMSRQEMLDKLNVAKELAAYRMNEWYSRQSESKLLNDKYSRQAADEEEDDVAEDWLREARQCSLDAAFGGEEAIIYWWIQSQIEDIATEANKRFENVKRKKDGE